MSSELKATGIKLVWLFLGALGELISPEDARNPEALLETLATAYRTRARDG
jgi:hypothetical protein